MVKKIKKDRKILLKIDAIIFIIFAAVILLVALTSIISPSTFPGTNLFLKMIYIVLFILYLLAAIFIWKSKKIGGIIAIIISGFAIFGSLITLTINIIFGIFSLLSWLVILILLILGWKELS